jgi:hypothetical protein
MSDVGGKSCLCTHDYVSHQSSWRCQGCIGLHGCGLSSTYSIRSIVKQWLWLLACILESRMLPGWWKDFWIILLETQLMQRYHSLTFVNFAQPICSFTAPARHVCLQDHSNAESRWSNCWKLSMFSFWSGSEPRLQNCFERVLPSCVAHKIHDKKVCLWFPFV